MSARGDAGGDYFSRTADLPAGDPFTWMAGIYIDVDTGANAWLMYLGDFAFTAYQAVLLAGPGRTLYIFNSGGFVVGPVLSVGQWYRLSYARSGNSHVLDVDGTEYTGTFANTTTSEVLLLGSNTTEYLDGRQEGHKIWNAALTLAERSAERLSVLPVRSSSLHAAWAIQTAADVTDYSGNGRPLTANGALVDAAASGIRWGGMAPQRGMW